MTVKRQEIIEIQHIVRDEALQFRGNLDLDVVEDYATAVSEGTSFPPLDLVEFGREVHLVDGWHRLAAYEKAGIKSVLCNVFTGDARDARMRAITANINHGLRRSNATKNRCVRALLEDPEWSRWSNVQVAKVAGVSRELVRSIREQIAPPQGEAASGHFDASKGGEPAELQVEKRQGGDGKMRPARLAKPPKSAKQLARDEELTAWAKAPPAAAEIPHVNLGSDDEPWVPQGDELAELPVEGGQPANFAASQPYAPPHVPEDPDSLESAQPVALSGEGPAPMAPPWRPLPLQQQQSIYDWFRIPEHEAWTPAQHEEARDWWAAGESREGSDVLEAIAAERAEKVLRKLELMGMAISKAGWSSHQGFNPLSAGRDFAALARKLEREGVEGYRTFSELSRAWGVLLVGAAADAVHKSEFAAWVKRNGKRGAA